MISEHLFSFSVVVIVQLLFFYIHARAVGKISQMPKYLLQGCLLGIPFGISFDLIAGKHLGLFTYELGFVWWFLLLNGIFSYGFMMANVLLLFRHSLLHMYLWSTGLGLTYEIVNSIFTVWTWTFGTAMFEYLFVILVLYTGGTWSMMIWLRVAYGYKFKLVPF